MITLVWVGQRVGLMSTAFLLLHRELDLVNSFEGETEN